MQVELRKIPLAGAPPPAAPVPADGGTGRGIPYSEIRIGNGPAFYGWDLIFIPSCVETLGLASDKILMRS